MAVLLGGWTSLLCAPVNCCIESSPANVSGQFSGFFGQIPSCSARLVFFSTGWFTSWKKSPGHVRRPQMPALMPCHWGSVTGKWWGGRKNHGNPCHKWSQMIINVYVCLVLWSLSIFVYTFYCLRGNQMEATEKTASIRSLDEVDNSPPSPAGTVALARWTPSNALEFIFFRSF